MVLMTNTTTPRAHTYMIRVLDVDSQVVLEDRDFAEAAMYDMFDQILRDQAEPGDTVQLIDESTSTVLHEYFLDFH